MILYRPAPQFNAFTEHDRCTESSFLRVAELTGEQSRGLFLGFDLSNFGRMLGYADALTLARGPFYILDLRLEAISAVMPGEAFRMMLTYSIWADDAPERALSCDQALREMLAWTPQQVDVLFGALMEVDARLERLSVPVRGELSIDWPADAPRSGPAWDALIASKLTQLDVITTEIEVRSPATPLV